MDLNQINTQTPDHIQQLRLDMIQFLDKEDSLSGGIDKLAKSTGYSSKTIKRYLEGKTTPSRDTFIKIYRVILKSNNDSETIRRMPLPVKQFVTEDISYFRDIEDKELSFELNELLLSDKTALRIYHLLHTGKVSEEKIRFKYGEFGMEIMSKLLELGAAREVEAGVFTKYKVFNSYNIESVKASIESLIDEHLYTQKNYAKGEQLLWFKVAEVDKDIFNEVLKIQYETTGKINELLKNHEPKSKNTVRMWTTSCVDTMSPGLIRDTLEGEK